MRGRFGEGVEWGRVWRRCSLDFRVGLMGCCGGDIGLKRIEFEDELESCLLVPEVERTRLVCVAVRVGLLSKGIDF